MSEQQNLKQWQLMIENYLHGREFNILRRTFILIDSRFGIRDTDIKMIKILI